MGVTGGVVSVSVYSAIDSDKKKIQLLQGEKVAAKYFEILSR